MSLKSQARKLRRKKRIFCCDECRSINEVCISTVWWTAWGRNCFDFNWSKNTGIKRLCEHCEEESWMLCEKCGALIDMEHYTYDWPDDYDGPILCPECLPKYFQQKRIERKLSQPPNS